MLSRCWAAGLVLLAVHGVRADDWPAWRGANGQGISFEKGFPETWSKTENIDWRTPLPAPGNSTPIVVDGNVLVTQAIDAESWRGLMCFERKSGQLLWKNGVQFASKEKTHDTNPFCSASPASDGKLAVVSYGSAGMEAYDLAAEGKRLWHVDLGTLDHIWGNASSPVIYNGKAILLCGPGLSAYLLAVDVASGRELWRRSLPDAQSAKVEQFKGSWCTPIVANIDGRPQLIAALPQRVTAFDPDTGEEIWSCRGLSDLAYTSPLYSEGILVAMSGYMGPAIALKLGGVGDITDSNRLWRIEKNPQRIGSGVIKGDYIYIVNEPGTAECIQLKTGETVWKERLGKKSWSSTVLVGERLYNIDLDGVTYVFDAAPEFKLRGKNEFGELTRASLVFSNGQIFARTKEALYCIGKK